MRIIRAIAAAAALAAAPAAAADPAAHWRGLTLGDVEAAHRMLSEDHPGAAPEVGDAAFRARLAAEYAEARARAARVSSYQGYVATLAGFAAGLGDKHIWSRPLFAPEARDWAGILVARRGGRFVVADEEKAAEGEALEGAVLLSCDGVPADEMAKRRLGEFRIVEGVEAQLVQRAFWLLLDDGNPFLDRPEACVFRQGDAERKVPLQWRPIARTQLSTRLSQLHLSGQAGFGVRQVGDGWWIGVESFSDAAVPVVAAVRDKAEVLKAAPWVVLDLRGNSGGNSRLGDQIADALLRAAPAGAAAAEPDCPKVWRISERNLARLGQYRDQIGARQGPEMAALFEREYQDVARARDAGQAFSGRVHCPHGAAAAAPGSPRFATKVILLTDNACFSSCLMVADRFRRLGALHVGEATDANTHYMEVREDKLPSGLSAFSTLQALGPFMPRQLGPFAPAIAYPGSIADTSALEAWVAAIAATS